MTSLKNIALSLGFICCGVAPLIGGCSAASSSDEAGPLEPSDSRGGDGDAGNGEESPSEGSPPLILGPDAGAGGAGGAAGDDACLSFMSWGSVSTEGIVPGGGGEAAIVSWLNDNSNAVGSHHAAKPAITRDLLHGVDVLLLHDLSTWELSDEDVRVVRDWVSEGGGVFALSGYFTDAAQTAVTNRLLSFAGLRFLTASEGGETSTNVGGCGYCLGVTEKQMGFQMQHPIAYGVDAVGAYLGRAVKGDGDIVAESEGQILAMSRLVQGGRVFLFHDDWIASSDKWQMPVPSGCTENVDCADVSPKTTYQIPQLWYNALRWLSPRASCFYINDESILR